MDLKEKALALHKQWNGKLSTEAKSPVKSREDLSIAYTPGVAEPCKVIAEDPSAAYTYTMKANTVAVISDGSAVLGLGNIGALAAMPVMEGKCVLFKEFADVNAIPIVLDTQDTEEIIRTVANIAPTFGGINLEDISAPRCFEIERRLIDELDIPVFHDDQHGTAIVVLAALYNALKVAGKDIGDIRVVVNGGGSAGLSVARRFLAAGVKHIMVVDKVGILAEKNADQLPPHHAAIAKITNHENRTGTLEDALQGADVFVGVSAPHVLKPEWIKTMADKPIIFAMANPEPEIFPDEALAAGAYIVGTGRSDFANQINNVLAFPGIFRGALDTRARKITIDMQIAAAKGIASLIPDAELSTTNIIPNAFDGDVAEVVAESVQHAAEATAEA